jgi:hypothetical protein
MSGPFSFGGDSASTQTSKSVQDQGQLNEKGSKVAQSGSTLLTGKSQLASVINQPIYKVGKKGNLTINTSDPEVVQDAIAKVSDLANSLTGKISDIVSQNNSDAAAQDSQVFDQLSKLAESQQTGGGSVLGKDIVLVVVSAVVGVVALVWLFKRRKKK